MKTVEEVIAKALQIDSSLLKDSSGPHDIEAWDSFNGLLIIAELEKAFKINLSLEDIAGIKTVGDIKKVLKKHKVDA